MTRYSVIIPTLNEADQITTCIQAVRQLDPDVEVIVADGGSRDQTPALAQASGARVVAAPRGRDVQLNAGAAVASGDIFVFCMPIPDYRYRHSRSLHTYLPIHTCRLRNFGFRSTTTTACWRWSLGSCGLTRCSPVMAISVW